MINSMGIAVVSGIFGLLLSGLIANACVSWYRVSSFEGKAGYFVVFTALAGGFAGAIIGLVTARVLAADVAPSFFKALGYALGVTVGLAAIATLVCRLGADIAPTLDGKELELEIELRLPKGFGLPKPDEHGANVGVFLPGRRRQPTAELRVNEIKAVDDRLIVPATVPLATSSSRKLLSVRLNAERNLLFNLPLRSHPRASDREWSQWVESGWDAGKPEPSQQAKFHARFRVRMVEPLPSEPDPEGLRAQEFATLESGSPLSEWLPYLFESPNAERTKSVIERINAQQSELAELIGGEDEQTRERALEAVKYVDKPAPDLADAVLGEGRSIADSIRHFNALPESDPSFRTVPRDLSSRFNHWKHAWWTLHQRLGVDGRPPVREIHGLALVCAKGTGMSEVEINARVILDALNKSAEEKKP